MKFSVLIMCCLAASVSNSFAQEWSSFQNGGALGSDAWSVAKEWSPEAGIKWQAKLAGYGQSTPIIFGDTAYVTTVTGPKKETISIEAFSVANGTQKWIHSQPNSVAQDNNVMISRAASSPVADENGVIAMFETGCVVALDHAGKVKWQKDFAAEYGDVNARHGLSASLEHDKDHVFVWVERMADPYVMALKKSDGSVAWRVSGNGSTTWASPRLVDVEDKQHLVLSAIGKIVGLDPSNGMRLWEFDDIQGNSSSTPVPVGNGRFLIGSSGAGRGGGVPTKPCCGVIEIESVDSAFVPKWVWSSKKVTCSFGSPLAHEGKAYFVNRTGIVNCLEVDSGEKVFAGRLPAGSIWATPLVADGLIYFFGKNGVTSVIEAGSELKLVGENRLWEQQPEPSTESKDPKDRFGGSVLYAASISADQLLLRRGDILYCVAGVAAEK